jgi:hypothetical protein
MMAVPPVPALYAIANDTAISQRLLRFLLAGECKKVRFPCSDRTGFPNRTLPAGPIDPASRIKLRMPLGFAKYIMVQSPWKIPSLPGHLEGTHGLL